MQGACRRAAAGPSSRGEPGRGRRAARDTAIDINGVTRRAQQLCPGPPGPIAGRGPPGPLSGPPGPISGPSLRPVGRAGRSRGGPAQAPSRRLRGLSFAGRWRLRTFFSVGGAVQAGGVSLAASPAARSHRPEARPSAPGSHPRRRLVRRTCGAALCRCFEADSGAGHSCTAASSWPRPGRPRSPGRRPVHGPGRPAPGRRAGPAYPCRPHQRRGRRAVRLTRIWLRPCAVRFLDLGGAGPSRYDGTTTGSRRGPTSPGRAGVRNRIVRIDCGHKVYSMF